MRCRSCSVRLWLWRGWAKLCNRPSTTFSFSGSNFPEQYFDLYFSKRPKSTIFTRFEKLKVSIMPRKLLPLTESVVLGGFSRSLTNTFS